jgi:hypothetical protein
MTKEANTAGVILDYLKYIIPETKNFNFAIFLVYSISHLDYSLKHRLFTYSMQTEIMYQSNFIKLRHFGNEKSLLKLIEFMKISKDFERIKDLASKVIDMYLELIYVVGNRRKNLDEIKLKNEKFCIAKDSYTSFYKKIDCVSNNLKLFHKEICRLFILEENTSNIASNFQINDADILSSYPDLKNTSYLLICLSKHSLGTILNASTNTKIILNHEPNQVVGKSINILMPSIFSDSHDEWLWSYVEKGEGNFMNSNITFYLMNKQRFLVPVKISTKQFLDNSSSSVCSFAMIVSSIEQSDFILTDSNGMIVGLTEQLIKKTECPGYSSKEMLWFKEKEKNFQNVSTLHSIEHSNLDKQSHHEIKKAHHVEEVMTFFMNNYKTSNYQFRESKTERPLGEFENNKYFSFYKHNNLIIDGKFTPKRFLVNIIKEHIEFRCKKFNVFKINDIWGLAVSKKAENKKIRLTFYNVSLMYIVIKKMIRQKKYLFYKSMFTSKVFSHLNNSKYKQMQKPIGEKNEVKKPLILDILNIDHYRLRIRVAKITRRIEILLLCLFCSMAGLFFYSCFVLYNQNSAIPVILVNSYANLRRKDNMLNMSYFMPYLYFRSQQTSKTPVFFTQPKDDVFNFYKNPVLDPKNLNKNAISIETLFYSYQKKTFMDKLKTPQSNEIPQQWKISSIDSISLSTNITTNLFSADYNLYDSFVYLNYIINAPKLSPKLINNYKSLSFLLFQNFDTFIETDVYIDLLLDQFSNLILVILILQAFSIINGIYSIILLSKALIEMLKCFEMSRFINVSNKKFQTIKKFIGYYNLEVETKIKDNKNQKKKRIDSKHNGSQTKYLLRFSCILLSLFLFISTVLAFVSIIFIFTNKETLSSLDLVTRSILNFDFVLSKAIITLENPLSQPLIDGNDFQNEMFKSYSDIFLSPNYQFDLGMYLDIEKNLCDDLATYKFVYCELIMNGILTKGYKRTFHLLVSEISELFKNGNHWFEVKYHEDLYQLVMAFIFANRFVRDKYKFSKQDMVKNLQNTIVIIMVTGILILALIFTVALRMAKTFLFKPWNEGLKLLCHIEKKMMLQNTFLRKFLSGN